MKKILSVIFALAVVFAGAFVVYRADTAFAETDREPWNAVIVAEYRGDVFRYELAKHINGRENESESRGFYLGRRARARLADSLLRQLPKRAVYEYLFPDFGDVAEHFEYVCRERIDATVGFDAKGFSYTAGHDGVSVNEDELFYALLRSDGTTTRIKLPLVYDKAVTVAELKRNTVLKGTFTTRYPNSGVNRCYNIARSTGSINGITVYPNETFSFNKTVGARTEKNGYKQAKVIMDGQYTDGVGGGVCQVSTTLYNALLLANFIPSASAHSLVSSYVKAGFDAMVSYGSADLTFVNDTGYPVYIQGVINDKSVTFNVYGVPNKYRVERESVEVRDKFSTSEIVDKVKYPELVYTDQTKVVINGSDGVKSQSYLKYYLDGVLTESRLIRKNTYKRVDCVIARGYAERPIDDAQ